METPLRRNGVISKKEHEAIRSLLRSGMVCDAWIVGGSLLRKDSKDIDVVVYIPNTLAAEDFRQATRCNDIDLGGFDLLEIFDYYKNEDADPVTSGKDIIVKLVHSDPEIRPVDLLVASFQYAQLAGLGVLPIEAYMNRYFPFSIQCVACNVYNPDVVVDNSYSDSSSIIVSDRADQKYIDKYKSYYPDKTFYRIV